VTGITGLTVTVVSGMVELLRTYHEISVLTPLSTERDAGVRALSAAELAKVLELISPVAVLGLRIVELVPGIDTLTGTVVSRTVELRRPYEDDPVVTSTPVELDIEGKGLIVPVASAMETLLATAELE